MERDLLINSRDWLPGKEVTIFNSYRYKRLFSETLEGGFGSVFPVLELNNNLKMMVKRAVDQKENNEISQQDIDNTIKRESLILLTLPPHPNVVESYLVAKIYGKYHIFMEYVIDGNILLILFMMIIVIQKKENGLNYTK